MSGAVVILPNPLQNHTTTRILIVHNVQKENGDFYGMQKFGNIQRSSYNSIVSSFTLRHLMSSVKGNSQNWCYRKTKHSKLLKNKHFLPSDTHTYVCISLGKKCSFFGNFSVLYFYVTSVLRFALLPYYRRYVHFLELHFAQIFELSVLVMSLDLYQFQGNLQEIVFL